MKDISERYRIRFELGSGRLGKVYLAKDLDSGRNVALKVFSAEALEDPENFRSFINEARILSAINHPNVVDLYEVGKSGSLYFIASEFVDGQSLRERMSREQLPLKETLSIAVQVANALNVAHGAGIIHRDIKPENIILSRANLVKIVDFGLAKINESRPATLEEVGEPEFIKPVTPKDLVYLSPEELWGQNPNESTDIWHLGVLVSEMVSRRTPFQKQTPSSTISSILRDKPARLARDVPSDLQEIVNKALRKPQAQRYGSAEDMASDLKEVLNRIERAPTPGHYRHRSYFDQLRDRIWGRQRESSRGTGGPPEPPEGNLPDVYESSEPQPEPLYLIARVTEMRGEIEIQRVDGFAQGQKHRVTVYLAIRELASGIVADEPSPLDRSMPHELYISFFASWLPATPPMPIQLKDSNALESTTASVEFMVTENLDRVALTVILMERIGDEVTPIQSGVLAGDVVGPSVVGSGISLRIHPHPVRPPEPTTDGVTIMLGDDTLVVYGSPRIDGRFREPGQFKELRATLGDQVLGLGAAITNAKTEKKFAESLVELAESGSSVLELLKKQLVADNETRRRLFHTDGTVRLWSRDPGTDLPVEFIYDGNVPDDKHPALCAQFFDGLEDGTCRKCENRGGAICAFDFWAFRRRIERRVVDDLDATSGNSIATSPAKTLPSITAPAAFGASVKVSSASRQAIIKLLTEGGVVIEPPATNWEGWQTLLKKGPHRLLVLLSHTERSTALSTTLEIEGDLVKRQFITENYVNPQREHPGPVVLLTGCETARPDAAFLSCVSKFLGKGAAVVVGTLALIHEEASAEATQQVLHALREVVSRETDPEHRTVGEIMRRTRCRMLAKRDLIGLNLVAYGDADWRFDPGGEQ